MAGVVPPPTTLRSAPSLPKETGATQGGPMGEAPSTSMGWGTNMVEPNSHTPKQGSNQNLSPNAEVGEGVVEVGGMGWRRGAAHAKYGKDGNAHMQGFLFQRKKDA